MRLETIETARVRRRWRPPLALLVAGAVGAAIALPTFGMAAVVALSRSPDVLVESLRANIVRIALAEGVILICAGVVAYVLWRALALPIETLAARTEAAARGTRFAPTGPHGTREIARLAESFAITFGELQRRSRYLETFTAHLAHELKSPLTAIQGAAELLAENGITPSQRRVFASNIEADARRLTRLVNRLRDLARADLAGVPGEAEWPGAEARGSAPLLACLAGLSDAAALELAAPDGDVHLPLDPASLEIALRHVVENAARHGARRLEVTRPDPRTLRIANDGEPIAPEDADRVVTPFFTTARATGGTGLGLAITAAMLATIQAEIALASTDPVAFDLRFADELSWE